MNDADPYLTTAKIAKMLSLSAGTVRRMMDKELIKGARIPGSKHRRALLSDVRRFAQDNGIPIAEVPT